MTAKKKKKKLEKKTTLENKRTCKCGRDRNKHETGVKKSR